MLKIGITGGIGSGKSHIAKFLKQLNYPVYSSDYEARRIIETNDQVKTEIINIFGNSAYINNKYNSKYIAGIVFDNNHALEKLNKIIHPFVNELFNRFALEFRFKLIFKESALIVESEDYKNLDFTLLVSSPLDIRRKRVLSRANMTETLFDKIVSRQTSDKYKRKFSDFEIINNERESFICHLLSCIHRLEKL